ncbi:DUF2255 family protein [Microbacterium rhizophilus]|uniref:DUF2255 family protein n=1 Tax=Microbacterium rhizophilus TaxID=3138934 RepID=UPI0031EA7F3B
MTSEWMAEELDRIGQAEELQIASRRRDGTLRPYVTIWSARSGDDLYVRSAYGPDNGWHRRALASGTGRIRAGGVERDVRFEPVDADDPEQDGVDGAYRAKYDRFGPRLIDTVVSASARASTLLILPRPESAG